MNIDPVCRQKDAILEKLRAFAHDQLYGNLLPFWTTRLPDFAGEGFFGGIGHDGKVRHDAPRGIILNSRLLWTFSELFNFNRKEEYLVLARRAYDYLTTRFYDHRYGGYYWMLDAAGSPLDDRKQTYAQAFIIFALSSYYEACREPRVLEKAFALFDLVEEKCFDAEENGYYEAYSRKWEKVDDYRLSEKDMNEKKSMNTHLHLLEAYSNLLRVCHRDPLESKLRNLIGIFTGRIIDPVSFHQMLFFDEKWQCKSVAISYGHDIETSWLLSEASSVLGDKEITGQISGICDKMARAAMEGLNDLGGLIYEKNGGHENHGEMEWWAQAEAVTGFLHAYRRSADMLFLEQSLRVSNFISRYVTDHAGGEWFYRLDRNGVPLPDYDKAGFWKCPYHNVRMCIEILKYHATSSR